MNIKSISLNAGHCKSGGVAQGAVSSVNNINESDENRVVVRKVRDILTNNGIKVYDSTVDVATSSGDCLQKIVSKANSSDSDLFVSIHFNSFSDSSASGVEVLTYSSNTKCKEEAIKIVNNISNLGFKNRGLKLRPELYVLKNTKMPALLVEVCFISNKSDVNLYRNNIDNIAIAIAEAIAGKKISTSSNTTVNTGTSTASNTYRVFSGNTQVGSYSVADNTLAQVKKLIGEGVSNIRLEKI